MSTTRFRENHTALGIAAGSRDLPDLTPADRVALRLGLALILWGQRHGERLERAEHARRDGAAECAARTRDTAFAHRSQAGPTW